MTADMLPYQDASLPLEERLDDLLARMTLEEKITQIYCHGRVAEMPTTLFTPEGEINQAEFAQLFPHGIGQLGRPSQSLPPRASAELTNALQRYLVTGTRLGIPALFNEEGLHGLMGLGATSFPQAIALASTWNLALVEEVYRVVAREARARGSNYVYAPVLDLGRDPRWGRTEETFGEDPYLAARLGVAAIRGLQGTRAAGAPIEAGHVIATAKHYAAHGQPEGGQNSAPNNISERQIREIFLPPFEAAVMEAGVMAVMAAYNEIDGIPIHTNHWLLGEVLRSEWGYDGFVTSDGFGIPQLISLHQVAADPAQAARMAIEAGVDVEVPRGICYPSLVEQVRAGRVDEAIIDRAVARFLRAKFLLGLFDRLPFANPEEAERINNCPEHQALALEAARQAIILLKNEAGLLPFATEKIHTLAVIGPNAADLHLGGYSVDPGLGTSILTGIQQWGAGLFEVRYAEGCQITQGVQGWQAWWENQVELADPAGDDERLAQAVEIAAGCEAAVIVIGGNEATCREGWWFDHLGDRASLDLLGRQEELAQRVLATGTPTAIVLINGRPLTIASLAEQAPAILECWYLGQETGQAVAEALFGELNPSGKLPISFPRSVGQIPVYYNHKPSAKRGYLFTPNSPLFPFGHGLSYTTFEYDRLRVDPARIEAGDTAVVQVEVRNAGHRTGDEVVQLYLRDLVSTITRPVKELKGFQRLRLEPGEVKTVTFSLSPDKLASPGADMRSQVEPGFFEIMVGTSSVDCLRVKLEVTGPG